MKLQQAQKRNQDFWMSKTWTFKELYTTVLNCGYQSVNTRQFLETIEPFYLQSYSELIRAMFVVLSNTYLSKHSMFLFHTFKCKTCSLVCCCHGVICSRFVPQASFLCPSVDGLTMDFKAAITSFFSLKYEHHCLVVMLKFNFHSFK